MKWDVVPVAVPDEVVDVPEVPDVDPEVEVVLPEGVVDVVG